MTIINTVVLADRIALMSDTSVKSDNDWGCTSKALGLPHLGAVTGCAGVLSVWLGWVRALLGGVPPGTDAFDLAAAAPELLQSLWQDSCLAPTAIVLGARTPDGAAVAWIFSSPSFRARRLAPGVWLMPSTTARSPGNPPAEASPPAKYSPSGGPWSPIAIEPPEPWPHGWPDSIRMALDSTRQQRQQRRVSSGGSLELIVLTQDAIRSTRLEDLSFEPAVA